MALRINTNITAINAHRNLLQTDQALGRSIERLSSGLRIVRASDDPAGFVQSEQLRTTIDSVGTAVRNITDATSLIQTTESIFDQVESLLRTMRSLALHAANTGPNDTQSIEADQAQIQNAIQALDQIATSRRFGARILLDGSNGKSGGSDSNQVQFVRAGVDTTQSVSLPTGAQIRLSLNGRNATLTRFFGATYVASAVAGAVTLFINGRVVSFTKSLAIGAQTASLDAKLSAAFGTAGGTGKVVSASASGGRLVLVRRKAFGNDIFFDVQNADGGNDNSGLTRGVNSLGRGPRATRSVVVAAGNFADNARSSLQFDENLVINGVKVTLSAGATINQVVTKINGLANFTGVSAGITSAGVGATVSRKIVLRSRGFGSDFTITVQSDRSNVEGRTTGFGGNNLSVTGTDVQARLFVVPSTGAAQEFAASSDGFFVVAGKTVASVGGVRVNLDGLVLRASFTTASVTSSRANITVNQSPLRFQIAENGSDNIQRGINSARPQDLGANDRLTNVDVRSVDGARRALTIIDQALNQVLEQRGALGAFQRQFLEPFQSNLRVYQENLQSAESNIRDADLAFEMINFTKQQILLQSGTAMLAQANLSPQSILQLLR